MRHFGLIGKSLVHSFSKKFFTEKFEKEQTAADYELFSLSDVSLLRQLIVEHNLSGLNVTIPYKQAVMPLLDAIDDEAAAIGAVNVVKIRRMSDGLHLNGYNTDAIGFRRSLEPLLKPWHTSALVLGTGGASKAVVHVLRSLGIEVQSVSRTKTATAITYDELNEDIFCASKLIVNTTPLGTYPDTDACPEIPYNLLTDKYLLYDLVYNPAQTLFLKKGAERGVTTKNGYEMLVLQAEASLEIWNL